MLTASFLHVALNATPAALVPWLGSLAQGCATNSDQFYNIRNPPIHTGDDTGNNTGDNALSSHAAPAPMLVVGPPSLLALAPTPYVTWVIYRLAMTSHNNVSRNNTHSHAHRVGTDPVLALGELATYDVALAVTYLPLRQPRICLEFRCWPSFPATLNSILLHLSYHFAQAQFALSSVAAPLPHAGAPPLACNLWLDQQLLRQTTPDGHATLFPAWVEQYRALRGDYPADPRRSFRAAITGSRRRLRR